MPPRIVPASLEAPVGPPPRGWRRAARRGVTLIELLVAIALVGLLSGSILLGAGALSSARLKRSASLVVSAVRTAYNRANATSRPVRLVFDFDTQTITLEEGSGPMLLRHDDVTGGATGATEAEQEAQAAADEILEGPRAPRPTFQPVHPEGSESDEGRLEKTLSPGIHFLHVEVEHADTPIESERAYLYFWPGGQTERAAIQIMKGTDRTEVDSDDVITLMVSPLTGKVEILSGPVDVPRPLTEEEASEREDTGF